MNGRRWAGTAARDPDDDRVLDPSELAALYANEASGLRRFFSRRLPLAEPADLVQEAFARLAAVSTRPARPAAFLNRIARNLAFDVARREVGRPQPHLPVDELDIAGPDPVHWLETRDMLNHVEQAIARLRPRTRAIFLAHRVDGLSYAEIAAEFGISVKGVEKQMSKAIAAIDRFMARAGR